MKILLLGSTGQLGHALHSSLNGLGDLTALGRTELDLSLADSKRIESVFNLYQPNWVINAAAYTAVDLAETDKKLAFQINASVPEILAKLCTEHNAALVHFSTDFVFDGFKNSPYVEEDATHPLSVYGQSKLQGEEAIQQHCKNSLIFRTSWLMGSFGGNFLKTMLRLARTKPELNVINDQFGSPTPATWLAGVTRQAIEKIELINSKTSQRDSDSLWGLYHASGAGVISWHQYARAVIDEAQHLGFNLPLNPQQVLPILASNYPLPARRPNYSVLNCNKLTQTFNVTQPDWHQSILSVLKELLGSMRTSS
jgi:dTDP-4-dehydrorhamnose reductase